MVVSGQKKLTEGSEYLLNVATKSLIWQHGNGECVSRHHVDVSGTDNGVLR